MNQDASSEHAAELRGILRRRAPDIEWHTVHCAHDREAVLWVRVRAARAERRVQFVVIVPAADQATSHTIAARIIGEALRLLKT